jgi:hypothetical protein
MFGRDWWGVVASAGSEIQRAAGVVTAYLSPAPSEEVIQMAVQAAEKATQEAKTAALAWAEAQSRLIAAKTAKEPLARLTMLEKMVNHTNLKAASAQSAAEEAMAVVAELRAKQEGRPWPPLGEQEETMPATPAEVPTEADEADAELYEGMLEYWTRVRDATQATLAQASSFSMNEVVGKVVAQSDKLADFIQPTDPATHPEPPPIVEEPNVWDYTHDQVNFLEPKFLKQLKEMMDPEMYQVVHDAARDMHQRYTMNPAAKNIKPIFYYQNLLNWFRDAKAFAQACSKVHQQVPMVMAQSQFVRQAWTYTFSPFRQNLDTAYEEYARFYESNDFLGVYRAMECYPTWQGALTFFRRVANSWMPLNQTIQAVYDNPLVRGFELKKLWEADQDQQNTQNILGFIEKAQLFIKKAKSLMAKDQASTLEKWVISSKDTLLALTRGEISPITEDEINRTVKKLIFVVQVCDEFLNSGQSFLQGLIMFCRVYPKAQYVARHILEVYAAIKKGFQQHLLVTAHQINEIFKEWILIWDKHEVEFFLEAHYLSKLRVFPPLPQAEAEPDIQSPSNTPLPALQPPQIREKKPYSSLQDMIEGFYHFVEQSGFEFEQGNQFPYPEVVLQQRLQQLADYEKAYRAIPPTEQHPYFDKKLAFLRRRVENAKTDITRHQVALIKKAKAERKAYYEDKQKKIDALIDTRIDELTAESEHWLRWAVKLFKIWDTKSKKRHLLEVLKKDIHDHLERFKVKDCPEARFFKRDYVAKKLRERKLNPSLLFSGRTGRMFEHLRYQLATRDDEMDILNDEIKQLGLKAHDVFFDKTRKTLEKRIDALKQLKGALQKPGCRLQAALDEMQAEDLHHAQCLLRYERPILDKIRRIEAHLSMAVIGRKTVQAPKDQKSELTKAAVSEVNAWLTDRNKELKTLKKQQGLFNLRTGWRIKKMEKRIAHLETLLAAIKSPYSRWYDDKSPTFRRILHPAVGGAIAATDGVLLAKIRHLAKYSVPVVVSRPRTGPRFTAISDV